MSQTEQPNLYLITPQSFEIAAFAPRLAAVLDAEPIACLRLALVNDDEDELARAADGLREIAHARDVPLVITGHAVLVERLGRAMCVPRARRLGPMPSSGPIAVPRAMTG